MRLISHAILAVACTACLAVAPESVAAGSPTLYRVDHLSSLGGRLNRGNSINNRGWVTGYSSLPANQDGIELRHASLWVDGSKLDLGTLGDPDKRHSNVTWPVKNNSGMIVGISQTDTPDPYQELWSCSIFFPETTGIRHTCLGFVWENGVMKALKTLGGNNSFATGANNRGQVVGWAENAVEDPTCVFPQRLQFQAVVWEPRTDRMQQLLSLPGDSSSAATAINDKGQVVGISGKCDNAVGSESARHAVLWENDTVTDLGSFGAEAWNTPMAINHHGDVVGFAGTPGDDLDEPKFNQAFIWTKAGGMVKILPLDGDVSAQANSINGARQVVGASCNSAGSCRAFLWENGVTTDLNTRAAPGYSGVLTTAQDINDDGVITGRANVPATGARPAFKAVPMP